MPCSRAISASRPRSSAERSRAAVGGAGGDERAEALERDLGGGHAERGAGALQQRGAVLLERAAAAHLGLHVGEAGEHGLDVALADRLALVEDEREQAAGGVDLRVQVGEQLGFEHGAHAERPS